MVRDSVFRQTAEQDNADGYWFFLKEVLGYKDLDEKLHGDICEVLTRDHHHRFLFLLPRGHLKSSCVTIGYPMWRAIQNPNRTFGIFNETEDLPRQFIREVRDHFETNKVLRRHWGHLIPEGKTNTVWKADELQLKRSIISRTSTFSASSIGKSTAGRHPDVMILDDVISDRTVQNEDQIQKSISRFRELQALIEPPNSYDHVTGTMIVIGTRWHWNDLYSHIIDEYSHIFTIMKRAAIEGGDVIFPQKFSLDILREKREIMKEWVFSAQYLNEPVDSENATFTPGLIKKARWSESRARFLEQVPCNVFTAVDPAWEGTDAWGIVTGCMDQAGVLRVLSARRSKLRPDEAIETVIAEVLRWRSQRVGFESVIGQEWLRQSLQQKLALTNSRVPVMGLSHGNVRKELRILSLVPKLQYGHLMIHSECEDLINELLHFPRGKFKDLADATEMLCRIALKPGLRYGKLKPHSMKGTGEYELGLVENQARTGYVRMLNPWKT